LTLINGGHCGRDINDLTGAYRGIAVDGSVAATRELFRTLGIRCISGNAIEARPVTT
jgi:hypothetical protein